MARMGVILPRPPRLRDILVCQIQVPIFYMWKDDCKKPLKWSTGEVEKEVERKRKKEREIDRVRERERER